MKKTIILVVLFISVFYLLNSGIVILIVNPKKLNPVFKSPTPSPSYSPSPSPSYFPTPSPSPSPTLTYPSPSPPRRFSFDLSKKENFDKIKAEFEKCKCQI